MRRRSAALSAVLLLIAVAGADEPAALPVRKTVILASGATYFIEGRQVIAPGVEITVQKGSVLEGRGSNAVLEVQGALKIRGVTDQECTIKDLVIEPAAAFDEIRIDMTQWKSGAVRTAPDTVACGTLAIENSTLEKRVAFDICFGAGEVRLLNTCLYDALRVRGGIPKGKDKNTLAVNLNGCRGLLAGLSVAAVKEVVLRNTRVAGAECLFDDCGAVTFDGNKLDAERLLFRQPEPGRMKGWKLQKTDFHGTRILFEAPEGKARDRILVDKCWFKGLGKPKEILDALFDPKGCVEIQFGKIQARPLELAG